MMRVKHLMIMMAASLLLLSCGQGKKNSEPYFQLRGICVAWDDVTADPSIIDWLGMMKETGMNTISIFGKDYQSP